VWCFEVTDVSHDSYTYDPTANNVTVACEGDMVDDLGGVSGHTLFFGLGPKQATQATNPRTILFGLSEAGYVKLDVFDVAGTKVTTLIDGWRTAGVHTAELDASGLSSGVYFYRLEAGERRDTRKVMLIR
jgi:hypothetical protein